MICDWIPPLKEELGNQATVRNLTDYTELAREIRQLLSDSNSWNNSAYTSNSTQMQSASTINTRNGSTRQDLIHKPQSGGNHSVQPRTHSLDMGTPDSDMHTRVVSVSY